MNESVQIDVVRVTWPHSGHVDLNTSILSQIHRRTQGTRAVLLVKVK